MTAKPPCCVRIRIEGKTAKQIHKAAESMRVAVIRIFEKKSKESGYSFYGYGNTLDKFETYE